MSTETHTAAHQELEDPDSLAAYRINERREVIGLLRELRDGALPVLLTGPNGASFGTTLWSFDEPGNHVSFGADESHPHLRRLVEGDEIVAVAHTPAAKLQFELRQPVLVRAAQSCALQVELPHCIYRFQRRESFRINLQVRHKAPTLHTRHPSIPDMKLALRILDLSIGGCALLLPDDVPGLQAGTRLQQVQLELDTTTRLRTDVVLRHIASGDGSGRRIGCEWERMDLSTQRELQRFIDLTQRRQRTVADL